MVLGHELTHGFDNNGALFDSHGNFENWWSDDTRKSFEVWKSLFHLFDTMDLSLMVSG